jgi:hypothetical protein
LAVLEAHRAAHQRCEIYSSVHWWPRVSKWRHKDIYFAENKIIKTLPKMARAAQSKQLAAAFNKHLRLTQGQVKRLDRVFRIIGKPARGKPCEAINEHH